MMKIEIVSSVLWLHPDPSLGFPLKSHFSPNNLLIFDNFPEHGKWGFISFRLVVG